MSTRDDVLQALLESDQPVSGEKLARRLGITRNSVWKAIDALRADGYTIRAATNRGYALEAAPDRVTIPEIAKHLRAGTIGARMELHAALDSTNTRAKALAATGAPHGYLVIAECQSGGKGRMGRAFFSPPHSGIYITYVLRPELLAEQAVMITSLAAVAVARAIEAVADVQVGIKWVNDLFINGKKVCGILCEAGLDFESGALEYAVLGIGINVARMEFPPELKDIATSIANECGHPVSRSRLIAEISNQLEALYGELESGAFMAESRERSIVIGREVLVLRGSERYRARAIDIDARGRLVVQTPEGVKRLGSGEVSLKLED